MKSNIRHFKKIKYRLTPSGMWDNGAFKISDEVISIPQEKLEQAVIESLPGGVTGVREACSRIYVDGNKWLVQGTVKR